MYQRNKTYLSPQQINDIRALGPQEQLQTITFNKTYFKMLHIHNKPLNNKENRIGEKMIKQHFKTKEKTAIIEKVPNYICRINPDVYSIRVTRSVSKIITCIKNFTVIEAYKCMPLLGDEGEIPNWDVHVAHYNIVFESV